MSYYYRRGLPAELCDEIISYLWNDIPSLRACALAHRSMTFPSQKRLFYCIVLRPPRQHLDNHDEILHNNLCGTSYNFWQLLRRSPHIANHIISLQILDSSRSTQKPLTTLVLTSHEEANDRLQYSGYKLENGQDVPLDSSGGVLYHVGWLPNDKYFPLCAPLLHKLKAFAVVTDLYWHYLSGRVAITLLNLIQLPSLHYLQIGFTTSPNFITRAIGENVKHLVLHGHPAQDSPLRLLHPPLGPTSLDSLSIYASRLLVLSSFAASRIKIRRLRKLVVEAARISDYVSIASVLRLCRATLEDLEITPSNSVYQNVFAVSNFDDNKSIDFSKLTALRRFAVCLSVVNHGYTTTTQFPWFTQILRSFYTTPVSQTLENISIRIFYYNRNSPREVTIEFTYWMVNFDALLGGEFINLEKVEIFIETNPPSMVDEAVEMLKNSPAIARLRLGRNNLVIDIRAYTKSFQFPTLTDVRWQTYEWNRWE